MAAFPVVVDMDFNITNARSGELRENVENLLVVLLLRVKKRVDRLTSRTITWGEFGDPRPFSLPLVYPLQRDLARGLSEKRLVMVGDRQPYFSNWRTPDMVNQAVPNVGLEPEIGVSWEPEMHRECENASGAVTEFPAIFRILASAFCRRNPLVTFVMS
jgi:hypothetical protein